MLAPSFRYEVTVENHKRKPMHATGFELTSRVSSKPNGIIYWQSVVKERRMTI
jgi:hypothetical protein